MRGGLKLSTKMLLVLLHVVLFLLRATASSLNETQKLRMDILNETQVQTTDRRNSVTTPGNNTLHLLVLLPFPDLTGGPQPSWSGGPNVLPAIKMAVEDINRKPDILQNYTLDLIEGDSGCNITDKTATGFVENVFYQEGKEPVGIIGPGCSASTLHIAPLAGKDDVALISAHGASTPKLENKTKYPYVFGGFTSLEVYAEGIVAFLKEREWTRVAVLYDNSRVFHKTAFKKFQEALANETDIKIEFASGIHPHFIPVDQIKDHKLRVTIILAGPKVVRKILCLSHRHQELKFPSHQFLIIERHLPEVITESIDFVYNEEPYNCSKETMLSIMEGNLLTEYKVSPLDKNSTSTINGTSHEQFTAEYEGRIQQLKQTESYPYRDSIMKSIWGALWYDMVWAMAVALNNSELYEGVNLHTYGLGMKHVTNKIYRQFQELDFNGMSGRIVFSDNSTFVHRQVDVYQVNNSQQVNVAVINGSKVTPLNNGTYIKSDYPTKVHCVHAAATVVVLFIVSVIFVALLITHVVTVKFRHNAVVKGSSPRLQHLAYIGCYLLIVATVSLFVPKAFRLDRRVHEAFCHIMNVCFSCGYTLITGTVCAKTWRLYRIFCHYRKPGKMLADRWLFAIILTLTLVDVVANIVWAATDHFEINERETFIDTDGNTATIMTRVIETVCTSHYRTAWTSAIVCYNVGILIVAVWLAILTRKVHLPQFQTKTVVILAYMLFLLFGLGVPLKLILDNPYLWVAMFLLTVLLCLFLLFLPPLLPTKKKYSTRVHAHNLLSRTSIITIFSHPV